jgi:hypothetical protein
MKPIPSRPRQVTHRRPWAGLGALGVAAALAACSTEEIDSDKFLLTSAPDASHAAMVAISMDADFDSYESERAALLAGRDTGTYFLRVDGRWAVIDNGGEPWQVRLGTGTFAGRWLPPGAHVFEVVDGSGHTLAITEPYVLEAERTNRLVFFGHRDALQHTFFSIGLDVPPGMQRYALLNLVRPPTPVEVVTCSNFTVEPPRDCTALSPPLGYGELFSGQALMPASAVIAAGTPGESYYPISIGLYARMSPVPAVPAPPVLPLPIDFQLQGFSPRTAPIYIGMPLFMGADGSPQVGP